MALPVAFDPQGFPIVNAITWDGGAVGTGVPIELPPESITQVTTDAGSFAGNFPGVSLYRAINGGLTLTTGSTAWARANIVTALRVGDYVEIIVDHLDAAPVMAQIATIANNGLSGTLRVAYAGAGGVLAAAQVSDWYVYIVGAAAACVVVGGAATLNPALANPARITLARQMGPGGRKGCAPLWARFHLRQDVRQINTIASFGLASNLDTVLGIVQAAGFNFNGAMLPTQVTLVGSRNTPMGIVDLDGDVVPAGGSTADALGHLYEVVLLEDQINWFIDAQQVGTGMPADYAGQGEIPDPYQEMYACLQIENVGIPAGATNLVVRDIHAKSLDVVDVRPIQPDGSKLHVTVDQMPLAPLNADLQGQVESLNSPDPSSIRGPQVDLALIAEPDHALRTRARVLTDEGSFSGNFPGASLYRALTGGANITMTNGLTAVTGVGTLFTQECRVGDYMEITAQHSDTVPVLAQIESIQSNLALTLRTAWGGVTATGAAQVSDWYAFRTAVGGGAEAIAVAAPMATLTVGAQAGERVTLARRLGTGGRKGCSPLRARCSISIDQGRANNFVEVGFVSNLGAFATQGQMCVVARAGNDAPNWFTGMVARDYAGGLFLQTGLRVPGTDIYSNTNIFDIVQYEDRADYAINRQLAAYPADITMIGWMPDPYQEMYLCVQIENTAGTTGVTVLSTNLAFARSEDIIDARVRSPDASQFQATVYDQSQFSGSSPRAPTAIADNLVHEITNPAGQGMQQGHGYVVTQIGGAALQVYVDTAAPVIATLRRSPYFLFNGIPWVFRPSGLGQRLWVGKSIDGTADADVYVDSCDLGGGY